MKLYLCGFTNQYKKHQKIVQSFSAHFPLPTVEHNGQITKRIMKEKSSPVSIAMLLFIIWNCKTILSKHLFPPLHPHSAALLATSQSSSRSRAATSYTADEVSQIIKSRQIETQPSNFSNIYSTCTFLLPYFLSLQISR